MRCSRLWCNSKIVGPIWYSSKRAPKYPQEHWIPGQICPRRRVRVIMTSFKERLNLLRPSSGNGRKPLPWITLGPIKRDGMERHPHHFLIVKYCFLTAINQGCLHYAKAFGEASVESNRGPLLRLIHCFVCGCKAFSIWPAFLSASKLPLWHAKMRGCGINTVKLPRATGVEVIWEKDHFFFGLNRHFFGGKN